MHSDAERTLAFVAKRQGTEVLSASAWAHVLSLELGWLGPGAAKEFIASCKEHGLLLEDGDQLRLGFDARSVTIPRGFRPPEDVRAQAPVAVPAVDPAEVADPFRFLIARIVDESTLDKGAVLGEVAAMQERFGGKLSGEAAAIRVALAHGLNVLPEARSGLDRLTSNAK